MVLFPARHQKKILNCNANKLRKKNLEIKQMAFSQTKLRAKKTKSDCPGIGHLK